MTRPSATEREPSPFAADVASGGQYQYTTGDRLSTTLANERLTDLTLASIDLTDMRVLDAGCGDGTYTWQLAKRGRASHVVGVDPVVEAIEAARRLHGGEQVAFEVAKADRLPFDDGSFDVVHLRGVLHHMKEPILGLAEALRVGRRIVVVEPNGYNPVLKALERLSPYHRLHGERSFAPADLDRWIELMGGKVLSRKFGNLVPFFCPDRVATVLKVVEPMVERAPVLRAVACGVYVFVAARGGDGG